MVDSADAALLERLRQAAGRLTDVDLVVLYGSHAWAGPCVLRACLNRVADAAGL